MITFPSKKIRLEEEKEEAEKLLLKDQYREDDKVFISMSFNQSQEFFNLNKEKK